MSALESLKHDLVALISKAQDVEANTYGEQRFWVGQLVHDLQSSRRFFEADLRRIPAEPMAREDALDNDPRVRAFTKEKAA